jgi:hypothetical protein
MFDTLCADDWAMEELPVVLAMMGPKAIGPIADFVADSSHKEYARMMAVDALEAHLIYLHASLALKHQALNKTTPTNGSPGRFRLDDALLAFLKSLWLMRRILLVISDGDPTDGAPTETLSRLREDGITVISCFVTDEDIADPKTLVAIPKEAWTAGATLMWTAASEIDEQGPFSRYLLQQGWSMEKHAKLFVQVNHSDVLKEFVRLAGSHFTSASESLLPKGQ